MLLKDDQIPAVDSVVQPTQIIALALISSVVIFALLCLVFSGTESLSTELDTISLVGIVFGMFAMAMALFLPDRLVAPAARSAKQLFGKEPNQLVANLARVFQTRTIFQMAFLEGAAFANLIFFFLNHSMIPMIVAGITLAGLILVFPRRQIAYDWIVNHLEN